MRRLSLSAGLFAFCVLTHLASIGQGVEDAHESEHLPSPKFKRDWMSKSIRRRFLATVGSKKYFSWMQAAAEKHNAAKAAADDDDDDEKPLHPSIPNINKMRTYLLVGGDILITEEQAQALGRADGGARRRKRVPVVWEPQMKWPTNTPICYYFDNQLSASTKDLIRWTVNFWSNNTCVSWQEGCATKPRVQFVKGDGCYSGAGRLHWDPEQQISIGEGCQLFHIVAHEVAHTLGYFHEQSRPDRDTAIKVHYELVNDPYQFDIQKQALTYVPYDYGSNMQYGGYAGDKIVMESLEKGFQHTMGSGRGPIFYDIKSMNDHYGCYAKCTNNCKNKGIPHPRDCSRCICPEGFGGKDCSERAAADGPGAPANCGQTVTATSAWQTLTGTVTAPRGDGLYGLPKLHTCCHYHIKAPAGQKVQVQVKSVKVNTCQLNCFEGALEVKFGDLARVGARICCPEHLTELGTLTTKGELAVLSLCSQLGTSTFSLQYKTNGDAAPSPATSPSPAAAPAPAPAPVPAPAPSPPPSGSSGVTVAVKVTNSWQGGAQIDITVTNNGAAKVCGATLRAQKDASTQVHSVWNLDSAGTDTYATPSYVQLAKVHSHTAGAVVSGKTPSFSVVSTKAC